MQESERASTLVRRLIATDLEEMVAVDAQRSGRRREGYLRLKLKESLDDTDVQVSLAGEIDGVFAGFLLARVYYGEFGAMEKVAVLDTIAVHPAFHHHGVANALMLQLRTNLAGLSIETLRTDVFWGSLDLLAFFHHQGFNPGARLCLELNLDRN